MASFSQRGPMGSHVYTKHSRWYRTWHSVYAPIAQVGHGVEHGLGRAAGFVGEHAGEIVFDIVMPFGPGFDIGTRAALNYAEHHGRSGYLCRAAAQSYRYAKKEIEGGIGREAMGALEGFLAFALQAIEIELKWMGGGAIIGGAAGALLTWEVGGEAAVPGAELGAELGADIGELFVKKMGLEFLIQYVKSALPPIGHSFRNGISTAWRSHGAKRQIDLAARQLGHGEALVFFAILQGVISYLLDKGMAAAGRLVDVPGGREAAEWAKREAGERRRLERSRTIGPWTEYIERMELKPPPDRGILWSKIGPHRAAELAAERGMVSLEMLLKENGFLVAYDETFGKAETALTKQIWRLLSEKYARSLRGRVLAFVNDPLLTKAISDAHAKPLSELSVGESGIEGPLITNELMEISAVMEKNPNISVVEIRDVSNPNTTIKLMSRMSVMQSKAAPLN